MIELTLICHLLQYFSILFCNLPLRSFRQNDYFAIFRFQLPSFKYSDSMKGISANLVLGLWSVFGGFLQYIFLCNFLTLLLKPAFDPTIESAENILDRDLTPFVVPGPLGKGWVQFLGIYSKHELKILIIQSQKAKRMVHVLCSN